MRRDRLLPIIEACFVTFPWSSSYVLIKIGLTQLSPLNLAALRYITASAILVPLALIRGGTDLLKERETLLKLVFIGFSGYTIAQGLQVLGLFYLPAVSVTFLLNLTPVLVMVLGVAFLREYPTFLQMAGLGTVLLGAYLFFNAPLHAEDITGVLITMLSGLGWATYLVSSRLLFVKERMNPLGLTAFSMGFGTSFMTVAAYSIEGMPSVSLAGWAIVIWLGVVNTALAFFLWNHALQGLEVFEISVLQNTMLAQIALLSWLFLGEQLTGMKMISMVLVFVGVLIVQFKRVKR